jgi:hypothetical protein
MKVPPKEGCHQLAQIEQRARKHNFDGRVDTTVRVTR